MFWKTGLVNKIIFIDPPYGLEKTHSWSSYFETLYTPCGYLDPSYVILPDDERSNYMELDASVRVTVLRLRDIVPTKNYFFHQSDLKSGTTDPQEVSKSWKYIRQLIENFR